MQNIQQIKCVVVGDSGVGKSSILLRYSSDQFNQHNQPTLGAAFVAKTQTISDKTVKFQIWDTAGQQKYQSIAPIYYRQSEVALCVYDISNKKTFQVMHRWVKQLQQNGPQNMMLVVIGNKCDIIQGQQVTYQEGKDYADSVHAIFRLTSAKQGKGISDMFISIGQAFLQRKKHKPQIPKQKDGDQVTINTNDKKKKKKNCC